MQYNIREKEKYYSPLLFFLDSIFAFIAYGLSLYGYLFIFHRQIVGYDLLRIGFFFFDNTLHIIPFLVVLFIFFNQFIRKNDYIYKRRIIDIIYQVLSPVFIVIIVLVIAHNALIVTNSPCFHFMSSCVIFCHNKI